MADILFLLVVRVFVCAVIPGALQHLVGGPVGGAQLLLVLLYEGLQLLVVELRVEVVADGLCTKKTLIYIFKGNVSRHFFIIFLLTKPNWIHSIVENNCSSHLQPPHLPPPLSIPLKPAETTR